MARRFVFIVNPRSANGATVRRFDRARRRFEEALGHVEVRLTERPRHACELARRAIDDGADAVIAVGGDGTNHEVVNGFFDDDGNVKAGNAAFGVVTSGTGGDFRRTFGWSTEPELDLQRLERFVTRPLDVGRCRLTTDGGERSYAFVNVASFGLSGVVDDIVNRSSKALGAKASFFIGSTRAMMTYQPQWVELQKNDDKPHTAEISVVALGNGQFFGGGMQVAPQASPHDGQFDLVTIAAGGLGFWLRHGTRLYSGTHVELPHVRVEAATRLRARPVHAADRVLIDLDGEQLGRLPATFDMLPAAIPLLV